MRGANAIFLEFTDRWKYLYPIINIQYLRPYSLRTAAGPKCRCLIPWEGFDVTHDSWILRKHITLEAITGYEEFLTDMVSLGGKSQQDKLDTFIATQQTQQRQHKLRRAQRPVALEASAHHNTSVSEVPDVSALSGR